ncbi:hypothetical protein LEMLEM_LOCUS6930 [Lemmus lemmus]
MGKRRVRKQNRSLRRGQSYSKSLKGRVKLVAIMFFVQEVTLQEQNDFIYEKPLICADFMLKSKPWGKMTLRG